MSRLRLVIAVPALALAAAACGNDSPTAPNSGALVFTAALSAQNEVPPVSNAESEARGSATIFLDVQRDSAGAVTGSTATFSASLLSFPRGSSATLAHIHEGGAGVAGGVRVNTGLSPATAIQMPDGSGVLSVSGIPVNATITNAIIANPAGFYFNVHTPVNPGGAVRGQLVAQ